MTRWHIRPTGPATVHAYGLAIPPDGIERELDEHTLGLISGDARLTVTRVKEPPADTAAPAPKNTRGKHS